MVASTIGAGNLYGENVASNRRTSSSVLINDELQAEFPDIKAKVLSCYSMLMYSERRPASRANPVEFSTLRSRYYYSRYYYRVIPLSHVLHG